MYVVSLRIRTAPHLTVCRKQTLAGGILMLKDFIGMM